MNYAVILASGTGSRFGSDLPKQFLDILGRSVIERTLDVFDSHPEIDRIVIVVHPDYRKMLLGILARNSYAKVGSVLDGGVTRQASSAIGVSGIDDVGAKVLIHDAARPFVSAGLISRCLSALDEYDAVTVAIPVTDTVLDVVGSSVMEVPHRDRFWRAQTPQGFRVGVIQEAHLLVEDKVTDDCGVVLTSGLAKVGVVEGEVENIKLTVPMDVLLAEMLLKYTKPS